MYPVNSLVHNTGSTGRCGEEINLLECLKLYDEVVVHASAHATLSTLTAAVHCTVYLAFPHLNHI